MAVTGQSQKARGEGCCPICPCARAASDCVHRPAAQRAWLARVKAWWAALATAMWGGERRAQTISFVSRPSKAERGVRTEEGRSLCLQHKPQLRPAQPERGGGARGGPHETMMESGAVHAAAGQRRMVSCGAIPRGSVSCASSGQTCGQGGAREWGVGGRVGGISREQLPVRANARTPCRVA